MDIIKSCICCYCCCKKLTSRCIQIIALICNLIEFGLLIYGITGIPWNHIKTLGIAAFFISFGLIVMALFLLIKLMCLRSGNCINIPNCCGKCLCITLIIFDILAGIFIVIAEIFILTNMHDKDGSNADDDNNNIFYYNYYYESKIIKYSDSKWVCAYVSLFCFDIALIIHFYCVSFLIKLINVKNDSNYLEYLEKKEEASIIAKTMGVSNTQNNLKNNNIQLTVNQVPQNLDKGK